LIDGMYVVAVVSEYCCGRWCSNYEHKWTTQLCLAICCMPDPSLRPAQVSGKSDGFWGDGYQYSQGSLLLLLLLLLL